jgi:hypothetical protein
MVRSSSRCKIHSLGPQPVSEVVSGVSFPSRILTARGHAMAQNYLPRSLAMRHVACWRVVCARTVVSRHGFPSSSTASCTVSSFVSCVVVTD